MDTTRRELLQVTSSGVLAGLAGTLLPAGVAPAHRVRVESRNGDVSASVLDETGAAVGPLNLNSTMPMASGAPLGGIGTGFIELRPDGAFYKWLIFNAGQWAGGLPASQAGVDPGMGPQSLQFLLRVKEPGKPAALRRLYLRPHEDNLYSMSYVQDVESIQYQAWFPMTSLHYQDSTLPVRVDATAFSPFIPGQARESGTPGFNMVFTLENKSRETVEVSLLSLLENPLARGQSDRQLRNVLARYGNTTAINMNTGVDIENKTTLGSLSLSVSGGVHSWISGTFAPYASTSGLDNWKNPRVNFMLLNLLQDFYNSGSLPNTSAATDPSHYFTLTAAQIDALSPVQVKHWLKRLADDALLKRVITGFCTALPDVYDSDAGRKALLQEIGQNLGGLKGSWGTGGLASSVTLAPGQKTEVRFVFSWYFPHHFDRYGTDLGHNYANWFTSAAEVNQHLVEKYPVHRQQTELFARTMVDTSLGSPMAFCWTSHLCTAVTNTWWVKDGNYAIWEGLGCCGLSTMDVEVFASFPVVALFPELKLRQMRWMLKYQNNKGQVPHNYDCGFTHVDNGWLRVDLNPLFVMMVCHEYLWTADHDYLTYMWPHVVRAMQYTGSLDTNGDGLPDKDTAIQTYDQWGLRGAPSYVCSIWIGALAAAVHMAEALNHTQQANAWKTVLAKASENFDRLLFNGEYYDLWVDGNRKDNMCMAAQTLGQWFCQLIGLPCTTSRAKLRSSLESVWKYNFNPEVGLRNGSAPRGKSNLMVLDNLQAGSVWTGVEYAFASFLTENGYYGQGAELVECVNRRYLRAGQPWNHIECGDHYSRPMSSWATLLSITGFKPDAPRLTQTIAPAVGGDFHAPWATKLGFGTIRRRGDALSVTCVSGRMEFKVLRVNLPVVKKGAILNGQKPGQTITYASNLASITFDRPLVIAAGQELVIS